VVVVSHGNVETTTSVAPAMVPVVGIEIAPRIEFSVFRPATIARPDNRGPPVSSLVS
jgi:hypothetical protein